MLASCNLQKNIIFLNFFLNIDIVEVQKHHIQQKTSSIGHCLLSSLFFFLLAKFHQKAKLKIKEFENEMILEWFQSPEVIWF
jgi:hypothetical protein